MSPARANWQKPARASGTKRARIADNPIRVVEAYRQSLFLQAGLDQETGVAGDRCRRPAEAEQLAADVGALDQEQQPVAEGVGIARAHCRRHGAQAPAQFLLVGLADDARWMTVLGIFDRRIGHAAAAIVRLLRAPADAGEEGDDLRTRIARMRVDGFVETLPEFEVILAQIRGGEFVLRREGTVEAGFGDAGALDDLVDPDRTDAFAIEQVARHVEDLVGGLRGRRGRALVHGRFNFIVRWHSTNSLDNVTDRYVCMAPSHCYVPVSNMIAHSRPFGQR